MPQFIVSGVYVKMIKLDRSARFELDICDPSQFADAVNLSIAGEGKVYKVTFEEVPNA